MSDFACGFYEIFYKEFLDGKKVVDNNAKNPGQGDKWLEDWSNAKSNKFPEKFYTLIKEELPVTIAVNPADGSAKFTCIVKSVNMEPGFKIGMSTIPAKVDFELIWVSSTEKSKILCVQTIENSPGSGAMGFDFTSSSRISESFAKAGKIVGKSLSKEVFK